MSTKKLHAFSVYVYAIHGPLWNKMEILYELSSTHYTNDSTFLSVCMNIPTFLINLCIFVVVPGILNMMVSLETSNKASLLLCHIMYVSSTA